MNRFDHPYYVENLPNRRFNDRVKQILTDIKDIDKATNLIVEILYNEVMYQREECKFQIMSKYNSKNEKDYWRAKDMSYIHLQLLLKERRYDFP